MTTVSLETIRTFYTAGQEFTVRDCTYKLFPGIPEYDLRMREAHIRGCLYKAEKYGLVIKRYVKGRMPGGHITYWRLTQ